MRHQTFHSGASCSEVEIQLNSYKKELRQKYGTSFLSYLKISIFLIAKEIRLGGPAFADLKKIF